MRTFVLNQGLFATFVNLCTNRAICNISFLLGILVNPEIRLDLMYVYCQNIYFFNFQHYLQDYFGALKTQYNPSVYLVNCPLFIHIPMYACVKEI